MKDFLRNYSLSITLFLLFISSWIGQFFFQKAEFINNAKEHNQAFSWSEYLPEFFSRTFENWESEFLQLFTMVVLTAFLIHKGSHESKDEDEKVEQALARIERAVGSDKRKAKKAS
jgi:hypothetical protein